MNRKQTVTDNQYVLFKLDNETYGIDILQVETIEKVMDITRVPHAPEYIEGVINLRGEVVPVIDLRKRFNLPQIERNEETRIIITSVEEIIVGLLVDSSSEVIQLTSDAIDDIPNVSEGLRNEYIKGIGKNEDRIIILLDLNRVLGLVDVNEGM